MKYQLNPFSHEVFCPIKDQYRHKSYAHYPFPKKQILDSSKLKEFADDNFKFDENCKKLSKLVENTEGKGEIACYKQFLLFPQCFQRTCAAYT